MLKASERYALRSELDDALADANHDKQQIQENAVQITALRAENERLRAALDILQKAMTAKKPIPMEFKKAIIEVRAALTSVEKEKSE